MYQFPVTSAMARFATPICVAVGAALALVFVSFGAAAASGSETGTWIDDTGKGAIEISPCGKKLCGRIVWLQETRDPKGKPLIDNLNPAADKRNQPICGLQVLGALERQAEGGYDSGWVYDPKVGQSYDVAIGLKDANHLVVTGYQGIKMFGKKFVWTRAPAEQPLARCAP